MKKIEKESYAGKELIRVTKARIKKLKKEIYNCCKTKMNLCLICFDKYHIINELQDDLGDALATESEEGKE